MNKREFLQKIYEDKAMKLVLSKAGSEKEELAARAAVDELIGNFYDSFTRVFAEVQKDPDAFKKAVMESGSQLINREGAGKSEEDK